MSEWTIVTVIAALAGLFFTVGKPIINLNTNITNLNDGIKMLREQFNEFKRNSQKEHDDIWDKEDEQDKMLAEHHMRLHDLDGK